MYIYIYVLHMHMYTCKSAAPAAASYGLECSPADAGSANVRAIETCLRYTSRQ